MPDVPTDQSPTAFLQRVQAEVEAEAELRRRSDPALQRLERDIERTWAEIAPPGAVGDEQEMLLDRAERLALVDVDAPLGERPGAKQLKLGVRKLTYWYVRYLADQLNALHGVLLRAMRRLDDRVVALERVMEVDADRGALVDPVPEPEPAVGEAVASAFAEVEGIVAVVSCGGGGLVRTLSAAAVRAYGVEDDPIVIVDGVRDGLDLRAARPTGHLADLDDGTVAGLVLVGWVEDLGLAPIASVVTEAVRVVGSGGRIVVAVVDPADRHPVDGELRRGHGLSPEAWAHLLERGGAEVTVVPVPGERITRLVVATP